MEGHSGEVRSVALCPGGRYAISGSDDRTVRLWDLAARVCVRVFAGHTGSVMAVALSTDGRFALSGSCDKTIRMWNMTTGDAVCVLDAHQQSVTSIALSACNRFAVSGSEDNTVKLWRLQDGKCLKTFDAHTNGVTSVCFSSDSNLIVSGSRDKSIKVWHLDWDYDFQEPAAWDEQARPYLADFLTLHCSAGDEGVSRSGKPVWSGEDFEKFLLDLQYRGYGWLRPDGVRRELEKMTVEWKGPPPMPWEQPS
jgi:WD40 repeat protein